MQVNIAYTWSIWVYKVISSGDSTIHSALFGIGYILGGPPSQSQWHFCSLPMNTSVDRGTAQSQQQRTLYNNGCNTRMRRNGCNEVHERKAGHTSTDLWTPRRCEASLYLVTLMKILPQAISCSNPSQQIDPTWETKTRDGISERM